MSDNAAPTKFGKPTVVTGLLPKGSYLARWNKGVYPHKTTSGNICILADGELIASVDPSSPDYVELADGTKMKIGGLKFRTYFILDENKERQYADTYAALQNLQMIDEAGQIDTDRIVAAMNSGKVVFNTIAEGEATYHRDGKGVTLKDAEGKDRLRGYGVRTVFAGDIGSRVPASLVGFDEHVF